MTLVKVVKSYSQILLQQTCILEYIRLVEQKIPHTGDTNSLERCR